MRSRKVQFRIIDVHLPLPAELLERLHGNDRLCGVAVDVLREGGRALAVVEVEDVDAPLLVPLEHLRDTD